MITIDNFNEWVSALRFKYKNTSVLHTEKGCKDECNGSIWEYRQLTLRGEGNYLHAYELVTNLCSDVYNRLSSQINTLSTLSLSHVFLNTLHMHWPKTNKEHLDICVVFKDGILQGCLPLVSMYQTSDLLMRTTPTQYFESGFSFSVVPSAWPYLLQNCPTFVSQELGADYSKECQKYLKGFFAIPTYCFDLTKFENYEEYFSSLSKKSRSSHKSTLNKCHHLSVENFLLQGVTELESYFENTPSTLTEAYSAYWEKRDEQANAPILEVANKYPNNYMTITADSVKKLHMDLYALRNMKPDTTFCVLEVFDKTKMVAINISVLRGDVLDDVVCIRNDDETRNLNLGMYCILKMVEYAFSSRGVEGLPTINKYNLVFGTQEYKDKFMPRDSENNLVGDSIVEIANFGEEHWQYQLAYAQPPFYYKGRLVNSMERKRELFEQFISSPISLERIKLDYYNNGIEIEDHIQYLKDNVYLGEDDA